MKTYYLVSEETFKSMLEDALKCRALESGGVDTWEWYGASIWDFLKECALENEVEDVKNYSFKDIVKSDLKYFKKIFVEGEYESESTDS